MGIEEKWESYIELTRAKADSQSEVAEFWDSIYTVLNLIMIFLATTTTISILLPVPRFLPGLMGAALTALSALSAYLNPGKRRQALMESSKAFRSLMLKMVRCESEQEYDELWAEYEKELLRELQGEDEDEDEDEDKDVDVDEDEDKDKDVDVDAGVDKDKDEDVDGCGDHELQSITPDGNYGNTPDGGEEGCAGVTDTHV